MGNICEEDFCWDCNNKLDACCCAGTQFVANLVKSIEEELQETDEKRKQSRVKFGPSFTHKVVSYYNGRTDVAKKLFKALTGKDYKSDV